MCQHNSLIVQQDSVFLSYIQAKYECNTGYQFPDNTTKWNTTCQPWDGSNSWKWGNWTTAYDAAPACESKILTYHYVIHRDTAIHSMSICGQGFINLRVYQCQRYGIIFEPTCATCTVGSYASLSVCLSVCRHLTKIHT